MIYKTEFEIQKDMLAGARMDIEKTEKARFIEAAAFQIAKSIEFKELDSPNEGIKYFRHTVHVFRHETIDTFATSLMDVVKDESLTTFQRKEMVKNLLHQLLNTL